MYGQDFWERVSWQQICEFLRYGCEDKPEAGSLQKRDDLHEKAFFRALEKYWKDILSTNWTEFPGIKAEMKIEELSEAVVDELSALKSIAFQAGFLAGLQLGREPLG